MDINKLKESIINGYSIKKEEAIELYKEDIEELLNAANDIRKAKLGNSFDVCSIINGKSGRCSEDCKYCAQSIYYNTNIEEYPLLDDEKIIETALENEKGGILRFSIVTSGRKLSESEVNQICKVYKKIKSKSSIKLCSSNGLLTYEEFKRLKESGVTRYHNNLETSRNYFDKICTTHTYDEKIEAIKNAHKAGLKVCSGGIFGLGESIEDRIDMAFEITSLGVKSIPVNILNPIKGTPLENNEALTEEEILKSIAIYRFIAPDAVIRLAGGRALLSDKGKKAFLSGANGAISGDMLTTVGISLKDDLEMIKSCGYKVELI